MIKFNLSHPQSIASYESEDHLNQYLLFHYGSEEDQLPFAFGPLDALNFPQRCVHEGLDLSTLPPEALALDLGCAVGRATFELSRTCYRVIGVDNSQNFIRAAKLLQDNSQLEYSIKEEGAHAGKRVARLPKGVNPSKVEFLCKDAMDVLQTRQIFHVVLAANLICRLPEPRAFLEKIHQIVAPSGQLLITSPYSWLEEFTSEDQWLAGSNGLNSLANILNKQFDLKRAFNMPFLLREHLRKYQWGVAQASVWIRK